MKNRLQIKYYMPTFPYTRENAVKFIEKVFSTDAAINPNPRTALPAEPIAVFYGENAMQSNVILAIGRYGDGKDYRNNAPYFLIDTANLSESLSKVETNLDEVTKVANQAKTDIERMKAEIKAVQDDILSIWNKIGTEADTLGHNSVYGYINDKVGMIMGGKPVENLTNINELGNAVATNSNYVNLLKEANGILVTRITDVEKRVDAIYQEYIDWKEVVDTYLNNINNKIGDIPEDKTIAQVIRDEEDRALSAEQVLRDDINTNLNKINQEIADRGLADSTIRRDFADADAVVLTQAKEYADKREEDAVSTAKDYTDEREKKIKDYVNQAELDAVSTANQYVDDEITDTKSTLRTEINTASSKLTVKSKDKSIIVGAQTSEGTDLYVNIDGNTIVRNSNGILSVASDKLVQYKGENSIEVSEVNSDVNSGVKTISLKINENEKVIGNDVNGLTTTLSLKWVKATDGAEKDEIQLIGKNDIVISRIDVAEFIKDGILSNVELVAENGSKILRFTWNVDAGYQVTDIDVSELIDVYTAGSGLELTGSEFKIKLSDTNENRFLSVTEDGLKLSGIENFVNDAINGIDSDYKDADTKLSNEITNIKNELPRISALETNLVGEVNTRSAEVNAINGRLSTLENEKHTHANKEILDNITSDKINEWNNTLLNAKTYADKKDDAVKTEIYNSFVSEVVTDVTPDDATSQTLVRKIVIDEQNSIFYVSNSSKDIFHNGDSLYNVIELLKENNELKAKIENLEVQIKTFETALETVNNRIDNLKLDVDMELIKTAVIPAAQEVIVPVAVDESKKAIISSDVFKAVDGELMVTVQNGRVTYGFDDDTIFMADYNDGDDAPFIDIENSIVRGGKTTLPSNVKLDSTLKIENVDSIVNLNNKEITAGVFSESNGNIIEGNTDSFAFWVKDGATLTLNGEGVVRAQDASYSMAIWADGGNVIINGGTYYNEGDGCDLIYASNGGQIEIYGGEFKATAYIGLEPGTTNPYSALNVKNADREFSDIKVYGGRFYKFNPAENLSEPNPSDEWLAKHPNGFVAEGYKSVQDGDYWVVVKE